MQDLWSNTLNLALSPKSNLFDNHFAKTIEEQLIGSLLSNIQPLKNQTSKLERINAAKKAKEYILESTNRSVSMLDICEAINTPERTIYLGFKELYGTTPMAFLTRLRLHNARKELLQSDLSKTVTEVAFKWKFYHLSRFARDYHLMFGEYPSETLKRSINLNYDNV